jgi:hypothetical protein
MVHAPRFCTRVLRQQMEQQQDQRQRIVGRPFLPGQSGNPQGARSRKQRHADLMAGLSADMGGLDALTLGDCVLLGCAVDLLLQRPSTQEDRVRLANSATRIVESVLMEGSLCRGSCHRH